MRKIGSRQLAVALVATFVALLQGCASTASKPVAPTHLRASTAPASADDAFDNAQWELLKQGVGLVERKQAQSAITTRFEPVIAAYADRYGDSAKILYSATTASETMMYLGLAATEEDEKAKAHDALVVGPGWGYAWFWKAYALGEMGDNIGEQAALQQALRLSPYNSHFLSELGYTYIREKRWIEALTTYESADAFVMFAHAEDQKGERGVAWRGQGYALVELGRFDEAEARYRDCIKLDPADEKARAELGYVLEQKAKVRADRI